MRDLSILLTVIIFLISACSSSLDRDLVSACSKGSVSEVETLIKRGANINASANDGWTPLTIAAKEGHLNVVKLLLKNGALIDKREAGGNSALFWASYNGHFTTVKHLVTSGAKLDNQCVKCKPAIDAARIRKNKSIVEYLEETQKRQKK